MMLVFDPKASGATSLMKKYYFGVKMGIRCTNGVFGRGSLLNY